MRRFLSGLEICENKYFLYLLILPVLITLFAAYPVLRLFCVVFTSCIVAWPTASVVKRWISESLPAESQSFKKAVLITGCDHGIGHGAALALNRRGFIVFAACLDDNSPGAKELLQKAVSPRHMIPFKMDVTSDFDVNSGLRLVRDHLNSKLKSCVFWALVNNAAISRTAKLEWADFDYHFREIFEVNVLGTVRVTRAFLPMLRASHGRVIVISSLAGRVTDACMTAYSMTKHSVTSFCDGLRMEMAQFGVKVICLEPWFARTPMMDTQVSLDRLQESWSRTSPEIRKVYEEDLDVYRRRIKVVTQESGMGLDESYAETVASIERNAIISNPEYSELTSGIAQRPILYLEKVLPRELVDIYLNFICFLIDAIARIKKIN